MGEFDNNYGDTSRYPRYYWRDTTDRMSFETTFDTFIKILRDGGFSKEYVDNFKLILWDLRNGYYADSSAKFEAFSDRPNFFHMSGLDPAGITFLLGKAPKTPEEKVVTPKNMEEVFREAMNQELLNMITI